MTLDGSASASSFTHHKRPRPPTPPSPPPAASASYTAAEHLSHPSLRPSQRRQSYSWDDALATTASSASPSSPQSPCDLDALIDEDGARMEEELEAERTAVDLQEAVQQPRPTLPAPAAKRKLLPLISASRHTAAAVAPDTERDDDVREETRKKRRRQSEPAAAASAAYERQWIFHRPPVVGESVSVTSADGDRLYLLIAPPVLPAPPRPSQRGPLALLPTSIALLRAEIDEEQQQLAINLSLAASLPPPAAAAASGRSAASPGLPEVSSLHHAAAAGRLWVDKYRPRHFLDLLSPDDVSRDVLLWLRQWDLCVFAQDRSERQRLSQQQQQRHNQFLHNKQQTAAAAAAASSPAALSAAALASRPTPRLLLLSGAPGLGKTTLAHVLAAHAGYSSIEINASDDRTEEQLVEKVRGAVEYRESAWAGSGAGEERPHCLIIDEIDGVMDGQHSAIDALLRIVNAEQQHRAPGKGGKEEAGAEEEERDGDASDAEAEAETAASSSASSAVKAIEAKGRRRRQKPKAVLPPLRRPIICICNDPYVPALRALRAAAAHFVLQPPSKSALVSRLRVIAREEGMEVEEKALQALVELVGCDVRSSINSLQWLHQRLGAGGAGGDATQRQRGGRLTVELLRRVGVGLKDMSRGRFELLDRLLSSRKPRSGQTAAAVRAAGSSSFAAAGPAGSRRVWAAGGAAAESGSVVSELFAACQAAEDGGRLVGGLHANYLLLSLPDPTLSTLTSLSHAFSSVDARFAGGGAGGGGGGGGDEEEGGGVAVWPAVAVIVHREAQRSTRGRAARAEPDDSWQWLPERERRRQLVRDWLQADGNCLAASTSLSVRLVTTQLLSPLLLCLAPPLRPVAFNLLSQHERRSVDDLIARLVDSALSWQPDAPGGVGGGAVVAGWAAAAYGSVVSYVLTPRVDSLCEFGWGEELISWMRKDDRGALRWKRADRTQTAAKPAASSLSASNGSSAQSGIPVKLKQMLVKELEFERIRRQERRRQQEAGGEAGPQPDSGRQQQAEEEHREKAGWRVQRAKEERMREERRQQAEAPQPTPEEPQPPQPAAARRKTTFLSEHSQRLKQRAMEGKGKAGTAAAGRGAAAAGGSSLDSSSSSSSTAASLPGSSGGGVFRFQYKEGFTQAVRRTLTVEHFL